MQTALSVELLPEHLRTLCYEASPILASSLIPLSENEAMCMFLGCTFKWGGPTSPLIKIRPIQDIWKMFVWANSWREDLIDLDISSVAAQMLLWIQESKKNVPSLKHMSSIIAPAQYRKKEVKLYVKGSFHCLQFVSDSLNRLYTHLLNEVKEPFELHEEELQTQFVFVYEAPLSMQEPLHTPRLQSVIADDNFQHSTATKTPKSFNNGDQLQVSFINENYRRGTHRGGRGRDDQNFAPRGRGRGRGRYSNGHSQGRNRRGFRTNEYHTDTWFPDKRKSAQNNTSPNSSFIPNDPPEDQQDRSKKAKSSSDDDAPHPRFHRQRQTREEEDEEGEIIYGDGLYSP